MTSIFVNCYYNYDKYLCQYKKEKIQPPRRLDLYFYFLNQFTVWKTRPLEIS
ncbi:conserved domain protein [Peptoniphilus sp. oral taxon 375 str. F0436]|nr:conserved domain protein [Peptoniphilus sp. oral taxon 375 str. F0436]